MIEADKVFIVSSRGTEKSEKFPEFKKLAEEVLNSPEHIELFKTIQKEIILYGYSETFNKFVNKGEA